VGCGGFCVIERERERENKNETKEKGLKKFLFEKNKIKYFSRKLETKREGKVLFLLSITRLVQVPHHIALLLTNFISSVF
jgi:hypothetical protein